MTEIQTGVPYFGFINAEFVQWCLIVDGHLVVSTLEGRHHIYVEKGKWQHKRTFFGPGIIEFNLPYNGSVFFFSMRMNPIRERDANESMFLSGRNGVFNLSSRPFSSVFKYEDVNIDPDGVLDRIVAKRADQVACIMVAEKISTTFTGDANLPSLFNGARPYVISLNLSIFGAEKVKKSLVSTLAQRKLTDKVVFDWFRTEKKPEFIEVMIGCRVPVEIGQCIIKALLEVSDAGVVLSLQNNDEHGGYHFGFTQRAAIGCIQKSGRQLANYNVLNAMLEDGLSQSEFQNILLQGEC